VLSIDGETGERERMFSVGFTVGRDESGEGEGEMFG